MRKTSWVYWLVASVAVILAGAALVAAEERVEVRVESHGGDEVTVDVNGVEEVIRIDDLAEGEARTFDVGDHALTVTRVGDQLTVTSDGGPLAALGEPGKALETMVWVGDDGGPAVRKKVIVVRRDGVDGDQERSYTIELDGDELELGEDLDVEVSELAADGPHAIFISDAGKASSPMILTRSAGRAGMVRYRCEESGSELLVPERDALEDRYICPATGCLMVRVEEPEVKIITVRETTGSNDD